MSEVEYDDFTIESLPIEILCPKCGNELVHDDDTLTLAESPRGAMFECGQCAEITEWRFTLDPFTLEQAVPPNWGGTL